MALTSEIRGKKVETLVDYMICDGCGRKIRLRLAKKQGSGWFRVQIFSVGDKLGTWRDLCSPICLQLCKMPDTVKERSYDKGRPERVASESQEQHEVP
jgi:hypothetical protein